jgi:hypothetical protein
MRVAATEPDAAQHASTLATRLDSGVRRAFAGMTTNSAWADQTEIPAFEGGPSEGMAINWIPTFAGLA